MTITLHVLIMWELNFENQDLFFILFFKNDYEMGLVKELGIWFSRAISSF